MVERRQRTQFPPEARAGNGFYPGHPPYAGGVLGRRNHRTRQQINGIIEAVKHFGRKEMREQLTAAQEMLDSDPSAEQMVRDLKDRFGDDQEQITAFCIAIGKLDLLKLADMYMRLLPKDVSIDVKHTADVTATTATELRQQLQEQFGLQLPASIRLLPPRPLGQDITAEDIASAVDAEP
jgi:hypothetical protein